jgi:hypothetical protein
MNVIKNNIRIRKFRTISAKPPPAQHQSPGWCSGISTALT